jgi:hypothetical protein
MLVADHNGVDPAQVCDGRGDRLTVVVGRGLGEPRVGQDAGPADLDQLAGVADPGHRQGGAHDGFSLPGADVTGCRGEQRAGQFPGVSTAAA